MSVAPEQRYDLEVEQIIADIRLKNRQHATEIWKAAVTGIAAGAALTAAAAGVMRLLVGG